MAILTGLMAVGALVIVYALSSEKLNQEEARHYASHYEDVRGAKEHQRCDRLPALAQRLECREAIAESARAHEREEYNLEAERDDAVWTRAGAEATVVAGIVAVFSLLVLFQAVRAQYRSAGVTREIGQAQVRCYLTGVRAKVGFTPDGNAVITLHVKNTGQSPARGVYCSAELWLSAGEAEYTHFGQPGLETATRLDIASGVEEEFTVVLKADLEMWDPSNDGMYFASLVVKIMGTDVFDHPAPEIERFIAHCRQKPTTIGWTDMKRAPRFT